jgi:hypothetical protein
MKPGPEAGPDADVGRQRAAANVQQPTCSRQHALDTVKETTSSGQRAADNVQQTSCNGPRAIDNAQSTACSRQRALDIMQRTTCKFGPGAGDNVRQTTCNRQRAAGSVLQPTGLSSGDSSSRRQSHACAREAVRRTEGTSCFFYATGTASCAMAARQLVRGRTVCARVCECRCGKCERVRGADGG